MTRSSSEANQRIFRLRLQNQAGGSSSESSRLTDPVAAAQQSLDNVFMRLMESPAPQAVREDARSTVERVGSGTLGFLGDVLDVIDTPRAAIVSGIKELSDIPSGQASFSDFVSQTRDNIGFGDVVGSTGNIWADRLLGFVGDVALDPLTYLSFGATAVAQPGLRAARLSAREVSERLLTEGVQKLGREAAESAAARVAQRGVFAATADELAAVGVRSGVFFNVPGTGRVGRGVQRAFGAEAPKEMLVGGVGSRQLSRIADIGYVPRAAMRRTRLYESAVRAMSGKDAALKLMLRTGDDPQSVLRAQRALEAGRLSSARAGRYTQAATRQLFDISKQARQVGLTGDQLARVLREGAGEASPTFAAFTAPQREVALRAQQFTEQLRLAVNAAAGKEVLAKADDYVFRMLTDEGRQAIRKGKKRARGAGSGFGAAPMMNARLAPGRDGRSLFMGEELLPTSIAGKSPEEQMRDIAVAKLGEKNVVQLFEDDWFKIMDGYIRGTSRLVGEYDLERQLLDSGDAVLAGVVQQPAFLSDGSINPAHPIHRYIDAAYAAMDEAGGAVWLQYVDEGMADMVAFHNDERLQALTVKYATLFGEETQRLEQLRSEARAWTEAAKFYSDELTSVLQTTPDSPSIPWLLEQQDEIDAKVAAVMSRISEVEAGMNVETQRRMAAVLEKRNRAARLLADRPSRATQERAAKLVQEADQAEALIYGRGPVSRRSGEVASGARSANAEKIRDLETVELPLTNRRTATEALQRPVAAPQRVVTPDPSDVPMSTARRFESTVAFGEGADEINAGLAGVRADYPTVGAAVDEALAEVGASVDQIIKDAAAAVRATGAQQAKDLSATAKRLRAQLKKLNTDDLAPSQMRVASEAMKEASTRLRAEVDDAMGRLRAVRAEIKDLEARKRSNLAGKPSPKVTARLAAARSTRDTLKAQVDELSALRKELDATSRTLADGVARSSELAAVGGVRGRASATAADIVAMRKDARADVRDARRTVRNADKAERASLAQDTRRVQTQTRRANAANVRSAAAADRRLAATERALARAQAPALTEAQRIAAERQLRYRRDAAKLFDLADTYAATPAMRDSIRLQAQANVAYADMLERGLNPMRVEDVRAALTGPDGNDITDQVLFALHDGMQRFGQKSVAMGEPWLVEAVTELTRINNPQGVGAFFGLFDKVTTFWKAQAVFSPGFHIRNFMGGMWNNYLAGVELGAYRRFAKADNEWKRLLRQFDGDEGLAAAAARERGGDVAAVAEADLNGLLGGSDRTIEDFGRLAGIVGRVGAPFRLSQRVGADLVERNLRGALALDVMRRGGGVKDALNSVVKYHFDYSNISRAEENIRRIVPFYTWMRNNFPLQIEAILKQPGKVNKYMAAKRNMEYGLEEEGVVPAWFGENLAIRLPFPTTGDAVYAMPALPFKDLRFVSDVNRAVQGDISGLAAQVNPFIKAPIEATLGRQFFGKIPFREGLQPVPAYMSVIPGVAEGLAAFGVVERGGDGGFYAEPSTLFLIDQFIPILGQSRRLLPNEPRLQERGVTTWLNFMFGQGLRVNSPAEQAGELYRRRRELLDMEEQLSTSGYVMPTYGIEIRVPNREYQEQPA